ncbi:MAG TPA: FHA domain-containing protein, partial [Polyangiaceae bacterium]|nr:FHA domain-containing protein [Polyangiaceae bacterium]
MIPGFSKSTLLVGSAPHCDIRLGGPGVAPEHARLVHAGGQVTFTDAGAGPSSVNGQQLPPGGSAPFDFRAQFMVGQSPLPLAHPALALMMMEAGKAPVAPGQVVFGRDPARVNVVINHPNVSSLHATFQLNPLTVTDHQSTSGTWIGSERVAPGQARPLDPHAFVGLGPVALPVTLVLQLAQALSSGASTRAVPEHAPMAPAVAPLGAAGERPSGGGGVGGGGKARHKTVIGAIKMDGPTGGVKSIGRTPDNDIHVPHPQVSSRHAALHISGNQIFLEDKNSANGTFVRGQRIAPGQRVPVTNGEKVFIGPMPVVIQVEGQEVALVVEDAVSWEGRPLYEIEAWDLLVQVPDRDNPSELKTLLDHVSFKALPGDFIALMGPSGAGKT